MDDFWKRCVDAGCVVVPVMVYTDYASGQQLGIRFAALAFDQAVAGPDYWFMIDESQTGLENLYETPTAALEAWGYRK